MPLRFRPGDTELDNELMMDISRTTTLCADLVTVDQRTNVMSLVHYTRKEIP
jgi:hypothetical protein